MLPYLLPAFSVHFLIHLSGAFFLLHSFYMGMCTANGLAIATICNTKKEETEKLFNIMEKYTDISEQG